LYLDPDTIAYNDVAPIFYIQLGDKLVAAAPDVAPDYHAVSRVMKDEYSNAGVLLMNLKAFGKRYLDDLVEIIQKFGTNLTAFDQCLLNLYTDGRKQVLDGCWNRLFVGDQIVVDDWKRSLRDPETRIAHYAASPKPWGDWAHPEIREHWRSLVQTFGLVGIPSEPITSTFHLEQLAHLYDINGAYREASGVKERIIQMFKNKLRGGI
jgi:lipopolysaccharide biosynthesis glycosyltransferase